MSQQQTLLRIETNIPHPTIAGAYTFEYLDLYSSIPIKINKSISEIQDIAKKNSDYSIGLALPGSKKNNRFFESYFNVDAVSLYFNATLRVNCEVLIGSQVYFRGYLRLNKVSVMNSKNEYDVTLYSSVGDLFGQIGNNLLKDLNYDDTQYTFNHTFNQAAVGDKFAQSNFVKDSKYPYTFFYPIVHNGYNYVDVSGTTLPNFTGTTLDRTRLYTSTSPIGYWTGSTAAYNAGVQEYYINSPTQALYDNQLKPALNIYSIIQLIFKTYGYKISSDFFNTPWFKAIYMYGYFSSDATKFSYTITNIQTLPIEGVELLPYITNGGQTANVFLVKKGTGIPCQCLQDVSATLAFGPFPLYIDSFVIPAGTNGYEVTVSGRTYYSLQSGDVGIAPQSAFRYTPKAVGESVSYTDGDTVNFSLVIDQNIKQIDLLSSIAKKFNLVFIPDENDPTIIKIEPFDFYVGTGTIYDWTPKLSYDKGFTVEPALNYLESQLTITDLDDGDEGNRIFKLQNNRIYGQNYVYNPTDFKSQEKKIETIFSPELVRKWDNNIGLPLGINYSASNQQSNTDYQIRWLYKGVKSKPKLFYWMMGLNPFIDSVGEVFDDGNSGFDTYTIKLQNSTGGTIIDYNRIPSISHTMPLGNSDANKIDNGFDNDSLCLLFNSELPVDIGVQTYDVYTENDLYNIFYNNRITNIYDPNTRMLSGYFDLKYSDILNLKWNDIIKINEQHFIVNKINEFNLTNRELTKVELLQYNVNPQDYPTRYFTYSYCDNPSICYKIKTDFTNENLRDTNHVWSIYYDNQIGSLSGQTSGFTSTFKNFNTGSFQEQYIPYTMQEITSGSYAASSCYDYSCDTLMNYLKGSGNYLYAFWSFWQNSGGTKTGVNVWNNCTEFNTARSTYGIITGSSTQYGINPCAATPTPTPTITPTPTVTPTGGPTFTPTPTPTITPTPTATVSITPTPTPTVAYDYYDADYYDCLDCGSGVVGTILVAFAAGSSVTLNRFYIPAGGPDGLAYKVTGTASPGVAYILTTIYGSFSNCPTACSA